MNKRLLQSHKRILLFIEFEGEKHLEIAFLKAANLPMYGSLMHLLTSSPLGTLKMLNASEQ